MNLVGLVASKPRFPSDRMVWVRLLESAPVLVGSWLTVDGEQRQWLGRVVELHRERHNDLLAKVVREVAADGVPPALGMPVKIAPPSQYVSELIGSIEGPTIPAGVLLDERGRPAEPFPLSLPHVVGPDGAHPMVSGTSGLAAKTSYSLFLLTGIQQSDPGASVGTVVFNGKGGDLLRIDQPARELDVRDRALWMAAGLEPRPLENVTFALPLGRGRLPSSASIPFKHTVYGFSLEDGVGHLDALLSELDDRAKTLAALAADIRSAMQSSDPEFANTRSWLDLHSDLPLADQGYPLSWGHHRRETVRRFCREVKRLTKTGSTGIFSGGMPLRPLLEELRGRDVLVIDIAPLVPEEQAFVVSMVLRELWNLRLDPEHTSFPQSVLIFIDELSKFAPRRNRGTTLLRDCLINIGQRGRSLGLSILGCEQGLTTVAAPLVTNSAMRVFGRTPSAELQNAAYRSLDSQVRTQLPHLQPGKVVIDHAPAASAVCVSFPRPASLVG